MLIVSIGLLVLSGYLFYSAYQLWSRYNEALEDFRRLTIPPIPTRPNYVYYKENYEHFFIPRIIEGAFFLILAVTLIIHLTGKLEDKATLAIMVAIMLFGGLYSFCITYQIWDRYQRATQDFYNSMSIPNAFYVEDFQKFFIPYTIAGVASLLTATILFLRRKNIKT